ncbi:MAG: elongation factor P [Candidatus Latescibacterota bacterium]|nr:elongation factor P [Candidatus Latescibacterota bacterium]MEC8646125.1 elongation factor P [Candidatus Latescibacterota bacterium]MEE2727867.1 elongation factor P [Candidatus Latescibacterota bacterium]
MADTTDFRNGFCMLIDGDIFSIAEFQHVKPGKGGAFVRTKLKNMHTGAVLDRTFRSGDKVEEVRLEKREMQYLYSEADLYYFMDLDTYEQMGIASGVVGQAANLLKESENAYVLIAREAAIGVDLPNFVLLEVTHTEPGLKGDTATGASKPATLETGYQVQVPLFVNQGDKLKIDTRTGEYVERV